MALVAITGSLRTAPTDLLEMHANILPVDLLLEKRCHKAFLRLYSLPSSHPLYSQVRIGYKCQDIARYKTQFHLMPRILNLPQPDKVETIGPVCRRATYKPCFQTIVPENKKMALATVNYTSAEASVWTNGSGIDGKAGAAAVLKIGRRTTRVLRYHLGPLTHHTTFDTEAVGMVLGVHLLKETTNFNQLDGVQILLDGK